MSVKVISLLNQKGGAGKTTLTMNMAAELAKRGKKVLAIDADPQGSLTTWATVREANQLPDIFDVVSYASADIHNRIEELGRDYDLVLIDGAPRKSDLARGIILASDLILLVIEPSALSIWASDITAKQIEAGKAISRMPKEACFVLNRKIPGTSIAEEVIGALDEFKPIDYARTVITQRVAFVKEFSYGMTIGEFEEEPKKGEQEIADLVTELQEKYKCL